MMLPRPDALKVEREKIADYLLNPPIVTGRAKPDSLQRSASGSRNGKPSPMRFVNTAGLTQSPRSKKPGLDRALKSRVS